MVSVDCKLISKLALSVEVLVMSCDEAAEALDPPALDLKPDSPLHLMCDIRNPYLCCIQF